VRRMLSALVGCCVLGACAVDPQETVPRDAPAAEPVLESAPETEARPEWTAALIGSDHDERGHYCTDHLSDASPDAPEASGDAR